MIYISKGSWSDAEQACDSIGANLWAMNSFAEWLHLSSSFGNVAIDSKQNRDMNVDLIKLSSTVILFIGQQLYSQVILYIFCVDLDLVLFIIMFSLNVIVTTFARVCFRCTCMLLVSHILALGLLTAVLYLINCHVFSYTGKLHWTYDYSCLFVHCYIQLMIILYFIMILTIYISNG